MSQGKHAAGCSLPNGGRAALRMPFGQRWLITSALAGSIGVAGLFAANALVPDGWSRLASAVLDRTRLWPVFVAISPTLPESQPVRLVTGASRAGPLWYGDRLKITFFETVGVSLDTGGDKAAARATVFPRMDLSGEFVVDEGGVVDIPKLGPVVASQLTVLELQAQLAESFRHQLGRPGDVHVAIVDRLPVYVSGVVRNPGTYKYTVGMIVLQALAGAGGAGLPGADTSRAIEIIRETAQLHMAEARSDRLLVKRAMLTAEHGNTDTMQAPANFTVPRTADWLGPVMAAARATLAADRSNRALLLAQAERQLAAARAEVEAQVMRADQIKDVIAKKQARLRDLEAIAARGSVPKFHLSDAGVEIAELIARKDDLDVAVVQAHGRLAAAEAAVVTVDRDYTTGLDKVLAATQQELDEQAHTVESAKAIINVLHGDAQGGSLGDATGTHLAIRITRRTEGGLSVIVGNDTTPLLPGDVVQVTADAGDGTKFHASTNPQ